MTVRATRALSVQERLPLVVSKFGCPPALRLSMARGRLSEMFAGSDWRVALVTGGPATGKTVTVAQWFEALDGEAREWVTLDADDDSAGRFWLTVAVALDRAMPGAFAASVDLAADVTRSRSRFRSLLVGELSAVAGPLVLVLDDVHVLRAGEIREDLTWTVDHLPVNVRLVLTSRTDPGLTVARWRAHSWFLDIRARDLAFTLAEAEELVAALGVVGVSAGDVELLWQHTEGWVGGLRIAATTLHDAEDISAAVSGFSGRHRMIADLLATEILDSQPPETQEFMLRTSVADVVDAELCDVLTGRHDSAVVLRDMEDHLPFFNATGSERSGYRYHQLLREVLRLELVARRPDAVAALHRAAAELFEARGEPFAAVRHLLSAGEVDRAFSLAFANAYDRYDSSDKSAAMAWSAVFPADLVAASTSRMLTMACALGLAGKTFEAAAWLDRATARLGLGEDPAPREQDIALADALRLLGFTVVAAPSDGVLPGQRAVAAVDRGFDLGFPGARARPNLARAHLLLDQADDAGRVLDSGPAGDEVARLVLAPAVTARIALRQGELTKADYQASRAITAARILGIETHIGTFDAGLARAGVQVERNQLVDADATLRDLDEKLRGIHPEAVVYSVLLRVEQTRVAFARGGPDAALSVVEEMRGLMNGREHVAIDRTIDAAEARWRIEVGDIFRGEELVNRLATHSPRRILLAARLEVARGRPDMARTQLQRAASTNIRDQMACELILARAARPDGLAADHHVERAVKLAVSEGFVKVFLEEGTAVARSARAAADATGLPAGTTLATALGAPPMTRKVTAAPVMLSDRERAVLRFLPTQLTYQEIARECLMSVNTVKTHLKGIYSKLGASSRSEAVERARALGVL